MQETVKQWVKPSWASSLSVIIATLVILITNYSISSYIESMLNSNTSTIPASQTIPYLKDYIAHTYNNFIMQTTSLWYVVEVIFGSLGLAVILYLILRILRNFMLDVAQEWRMIQASASSTVRELLKIFIVRSILVILTIGYADLWVNTILPNTTESFIRGYQVFPDPQSFVDIIILSIACLLLSLHVFIVLARLLFRRQRLLS